MCGQLQRRRASSSRAPRRRAARAPRRRRARRSARTAAACRGSSRGPARPPRARSRSSSSRPRSRQQLHRRPGTRRRRAGRARRRARSSSWSAVSTRARADPLERLLDRAAVAHAVVDDRRSVAPRAPLISRSASPSSTGTPVSVGSIATACAQRAGERLEGRLDHVVGVRAALRPSTCSVSFAPCRRTARKNSSTSSWSKSPVAAAAAGRPRRRGTAGREMSIAHVARASSIGTTRVPVARDAGAVAERLGRAPGRARCRCPRRCGARRSAGRP